MQIRSKAATVAVTTALVGVAVATLLVVPGRGQTAAAYRAARTPDGKPDLNGIWQALNTANWDIQDHPAKQGPIVALGAAFSQPAGQGIVEGNEIPYKPEALAKKRANGENWVKNDPEVKCYMPGIPRATYMPYPFQIVQTPNAVLFAYEFASASRVVQMNSKDEAPVDSWMGWSRGRWEGETLVVDVTGMVDTTWFDRAGNHHSDQLHVVERYTATSPNTLNYEATIEDPMTFTRSWKMSFPLYRRIEKNAQLLEYKCVEFAEELLYGHLRRQTK
jgi:hypothetical protein